MFYSANQDKTLALAGLVQAGKIVTQLAAQPQHDEQALRASALSLLQINTLSVEEVFGGASGVELGLTNLQGMLRGRGFQSIEAKEMIRYLMSMDQLAERLKRSSSTQEIIQKGLYDLTIQFESLLDAELDTANIVPFEDEFDQFYQRIGTLYQKSLSRLSPQIIVRGAKGYLKSEESVALVRTALFSGVRAAFLWHQQGAKRWHLLFSRGQYVQLSQQLLDRVNK